MSSSSKISARIVVAYWPGNKKNFRDKALPFSNHCQDKDSGRVTRARRSGFMRVALNKWASSGWASTISRSIVPCSPVAVVPPSPHKGPVGKPSCGEGSPGNTVNQLPASTLAASTSLNNHERAAEKYNTFFEAFLPPRPRFRFRRVGSRLTARSRFPPPKPKRWGPK